MAIVASLSKLSRCDRNSSIRSASFGKLCGVESQHARYGAPNTTVTVSENRVRRVRIGCKIDVRFILKIGEVHRDYAYNSAHLYGVDSLLDVVNVDGVVLTAVDGVAYSLQNRWGKTCCLSTSSVEQVCGCVIKWTNKLEVGCSAWLKSIIET